MSSIIVRVEGMIPDDPDAGIHNVKCLERAITDAHAGSADQVTILLPLGKYAWAGFPLDPSVGVMLTGGGTACLIKDFNRWYRLRYKLRQLWRHLSGYPEPPDLD